MKNKALMYLSRHDLQKHFLGGWAIAASLGALGPLWMFSGATFIGILKEIGDSWLWEGTREIEDVIATSMGGLVGTCAFLVLAYLILLI